MWNDIKLFITEAYNYLGQLSLSAWLIIGVLVWSGHLLFNCNQYVCTLMLK